MVHNSFQDIPLAKVQDVSLHQRPLHLEACRLLCLNEEQLWHRSEVSPGNAALAALIAVLARALANNMTPLLKHAEANMERLLLRQANDDI